MDLQTSLLGENISTAVDLPATFQKVGSDCKYLSRAQCVISKPSVGKSHSIFLSLYRCGEWVFFSLPGGIFLSFSIKTTKT